MSCSIPPFGGGDRTVGHCVDVVHIEDIDLVAAETREAGLDRPHHPVPRIVVGDLQRRRVDIDAFRRLARAARPKQTPDLGREDHLGLAAQSRAEPLFGEAKTIERGGVEIA